MKIYCTLAVIRVHPVRVKWQIGSASLHYVWFFPCSGIYRLSSSSREPSGWRKEPKLIHHYLRKIYSVCKNILYMWNGPHSSVSSLLQRSASVTILQASVVYYELIFLFKLRDIFRSRLSRIRFITSIFCQASILRLF